MKNPLRIALILETAGGGSGRHVLDLAHGLASRGHAVTVIWSPTRAQPDFVTRLNATPGVENNPLAMNRAVGPSDLQSLRALATLLRRHTPFDILHGHSSKAGALIRLLPRAIPGARIYTPHAFRTMDPDLKPPQRLIYKTIERLLAPRAARIITVSNAERDHARAMGIAAARLALVVNGAALPADATRAKARAAMGMGDDDIAVGFIGRLDTQKDPLRFVRAISAATHSVPTIRGVVIGDGPLRGVAETEAEAAGSTTRFLGWRDGPALFPGLDLFCMTSQYEAMPYTLIEALHAGVPIVTTAVGGAAETVRDGENGRILSLSCSAETVGEAIAVFGGDAALRQAAGAASRRLAGTRSLDTMLNETLAVYAGAI